MVFSSIVFIYLFLPIVLLIYYCVNGKNKTYRNIVLLIASLIFYAWGEPVLVFLMIISIIITWILGKCIACYKKYSLSFLYIGCLYHLIILFIFKYFTFLWGEISHLLKINFPLINIGMPIGISFFTFQLISYLVDVYSGKTEVQKNILNLGLYVALFPQLIAGPIVRYNTIVNQITDRTEASDDIVVGLRRFVVGLGKKVLLADFLAVVSDNIFYASEAGNIGLITAWIGAISYMLEIYYDFSGYSDMAIGIGRCFGFRLNENFNYPYIAVSVNEFWKRWHISLTDWFRDYVYIPLGGNRVSKVLNIRNIIVVWILTGVWHGANWTFLLWGIVYCVFQLLEKYIYDTSKWNKHIQHVYTLAVICLCWVVFRANNISEAVKYIGSMFGTQGICDSNSMFYLENSIVIIVLGTYLSIPHNYIKDLYRLEIGNSKRIGGNTVVVLILILTTIMLVSGGYSPFIYYNF